MVLLTLAGRDRVPHPHPCEGAELAHLYLAVLVAPQPQVGAQVVGGVDVARLLGQDGGEGAAHLLCSGSCSGHLVRHLETLLLHTTL